MSCALRSELQTADFYRLSSTYSSDVNVCVTSAEHIKCAINDGKLAYLMQNKFLHSWRSCI